MNSEMIVGEGYFVIDLHLVEQPVRVALQDFCEVNADIAGRLPESVHDSAQGGLVNAQHPRQAVLSDARGVHPKFQVGINVSIQGHGFALVLYWNAASYGGNQKLLLPEL